MTEKQTCEWEWDERHDKWDTACGNAFQFIDDTPVGNGFIYCCFCGGILIC